MERLKYKMKSLIIFFSHRGENYSVGYIKEGNVEHIAKVIKELTNADIYEWRCKKILGQCLKIHYLILMGMI